MSGNLEKISPEKMLEGLTRVLSELSLRKRKFLSDNKIFLVEMGSIRRKEALSTIAEKVIRKLNQYIS